MIVDCTASAAIAPALSRVARCRHSHRDAEQAGGKRGHGVLSDAGRGAPRRRIALPLRGDRRRRPADYPDAARSPRDRGSDPADRRASCPERCRICSTSGTGSSRSRRLSGRPRRRGFTEPDPRDDLSGTDVARKLIILAREMGLDLELGDVQLEGLVPASLESGGATSSWRACRKSTRPCASVSRRRARAASVLRYVGAAGRRQGRATVGLVELDRSHLVCEHQPHRQRRQLHDQPLRPQSAHRARTRRGAGGHGGRRLRRPAARLRVSRGARCDAARPGHRVRAGERRQRRRRVRRPRLQRGGRRRPRARRAHARPSASASPQSPGWSWICRSSPSGTPPAWRWRAMADALGLDFGFELTIEKGIPLGPDSAGRPPPRWRPWSRLTRCSTNRSTTCAC